MRIIKNLVLVLLVLSLLMLAGCDKLPIDLDKILGKEEPVAHEHTLVQHEGLAPTCTEAGWLPYETCSTCEEYTTYTALEALGHDYATTPVASGDHHSRFCLRCTESLDDAHEWELVEVTAPTCTLGGSESYKCSACDAKKLVGTEKLGHDFSDEYVANGEVHSYLCSRCDATEDAAHEWNEGELTTAPTCTEDGILTYTCAVCGATKGEAKDSLGHDFVGGFVASEDYHSALCTRCDATVDTPHEWQAGEYVTAPTCESAGVQSYSCALCSATTERAASALGHDIGEEYLPNGDVHSRFCSRCDATVDGEHEWVESEDSVYPTCTDGGKLVYACTVCADVKEEYLESLGHALSEEFTDEGDVHTMSCARCDYSESYVHEWQEGELLFAPTCVDSGIQTYFCEVCGKSEERVLPATGVHTDGDWETVKEATSTDSGKDELRCTVCNALIDERAIPSDAESMARLYLDGEYQNATAAKNEVDMQFSLIQPDGTTYDGYAKMKVQGSSSVAYAKKNYTLKLYKDADFSSKNKINVGWGKENKYVIKANWVDFTNARNIVSCRLWGDIVKSRAASDIQQRLADLKTNGGAVDGFPVAVYMNGVFYGLYTFNVPKDEWMFDMDDSETEAILGADDWNHTDFNTLIGSFYEDSKSGDIVSKDGGWELIYCGSDDYSWVAPSFDALIKFCQENDGEAFRAGASEYLDVDAAIDYIIYMYAVCMRDNASKNMLWITYDGKRWTPSVYDQDGTFGQSWDGVNAAAPTYCLPTVKDGKVLPNIPFGPNAHPVNFILWDRILNCYTEEVLLRYKELRESTLSVSNMQAELRAFEESVPASIYEADRTKWAADRDTWWTSKRGSGVWYEKFNFAYMYQWVENRMANYDNVMRNIYENVYLPKTDNPAL